MVLLHLVTFQWLQREAELFCQPIVMSNMLSPRDSAQVYKRVYSASPKQWKFKSGTAWDLAGEVSWNAQAPEKAS